MSAESGESDRPVARAPSPGDDASPFLLRVIVTHGKHFRPLQEYEYDDRILRHEYKLYVWRSATLKHLCQLLHSADPQLSTALTSHSFRLIYYDYNKRQYTFKEMGSNITRISHEDVLKQLDSKQSKELFGTVTPASHGAGVKLSEMEIRDGDRVECLVDSDAGRGKARDQNQNWGPPRSHDRRW
ncbi:unnamed protein product [Sympodiomycopsis kandeliae]